MKPTPAEVVFSLPGVHALDTLEGPAIVGGWLCLFCFNYWPTLEEALKDKCEGGA